MKAKLNNKAVTFTYFKQDEETERLGILLAQPTDLYSVLEIDPDSDGPGIDEIAEAVQAEMAVLAAQRAAVIADLSRKYNLQFKNFKESGVHDLKEV